ncbi:unnamed protein product [Mytilus edulis]|uniref:Reverse transcriptase domain-containing protein n=1 Tax=Mytilus edulis TaxID=6550 RepID=A0A8S3SMR7_MYTED|nr:unnamed protein product [Mytilus edulis]
MHSLSQTKEKDDNTTPPWWNDDIREMKGKLNKAQKKFKLRSTPENFENVAKAENDFEMTKKDAQNKWSEDLCEKIGEAKSLREKWSNFKKLTKKKSENLVHPLQELYKPNYNLPSSYRPISLTSVVAKLMERIITYRLEGFVEMNNIMDQEQEGFRHFRGTTNALLSLTQAIFNGFNKDKTTIVIFIDFEKAYDSVGERV